METITGIFPFWSKKKCCRADRGSQCLLWSPLGIYTELGLTLTWKVAVLYTYEQSRHNSMISLLASNQRTHPLCLFFPVAKVLCPFCLAVLLNCAGVLLADKCKHRCLYWICSLVGTCWLLLSTGMKWQDFSFWEHQSGRKCKMDRENRGSCWEVKNGAEKRRH